MLIGRTTKKPNLVMIRRVKRVLRETLNLPDDATITLTELACLEEDCPPVETVFGLLQSDGSQLQHKIHKPVNDVDSDDLIQVCRAWSFDVETTLSLNPSPRRVK